MEEVLTGQKVYLVKATLGETKGILGVFDSAQSAEQFAQNKYHEWTRDEGFTWGEGQTAKQVVITTPGQDHPLKGGLVISELPVRAK